MAYFWNWSFFHYEKIIKFDKSPQLPGTRKTRAWHHHGSEISSFPRAILVHISLLYHLLKIPNLHFTDCHFHPKIQGNTMIRNMKEILTKSIILYAHLGPPVILVKHLPYNQSTYRDSLVARPYCMYISN